MSSRLDFDDEVYYQYNQQQRRAAGYAGCDSFAVYAPRITGGISFISSVLIIVIILQSPAKLKTVYHRLMFFMSCADVLGSVAMGLTNLPSPRLDPVYNCPDTGAIGNVRSCEAQGFFYVFGLSCMFAYNAMLCVYYACAIALQMREKNIVKYVEPILHTAAIGCGSAWAVPPLVYNLYNPTPWDSWCSISLGEVGSFKVFEAAIRNMANMDLLLIITILFLLFLVLTCFTLIIWRVFRTEQSLYGPKNMVRRSRMGSLQQIERSHKNTKILLYQAVAYFLAYMITLSPLFVRAMVVEPLWLIRLQFVLMPLQGFFNALIFIFHKVYNYRRIYDDVSFCTVFKKLLHGLAQENVLFSRISMINIDEGENRAHIEIEDERNVEQFDNISFDMVPASQGFAEPSVGDHESRDNLSGFSDVIEGATEGNQEANNDSRAGLSGYLDTSPPELESTFDDDAVVAASINEETEEGLSYSRQRSIFSSFRGLSWSQERGNNVSSAASRFD